MKKHLLVTVVVLAITACSEPVKYDLVIQNVGLFDGNEDRGIVSIAVNADTIAQISEELLTGDSIIDGAGKYLIPGMVNAHVHASSLENLQEGYRYGILTILNMHTGLEERELEWKQMSRDSIGYSTLYGAGYAATLPGGHPTAFSPEMETINDTVSIEKWVDHRIENEVDYIKIIHDNHEWMGNPALPTLAYEQIEEIIEVAKSKGYLTVVHANSVDAMLEIAEFKPDGFVHMPDFKEDYPISEGFYKALVESGAFVVPTGGIALKPRHRAPPFIREWVENNLLDADQRAEIIRELHKHGILIVAGTDAQGGQMNFGEDFFLELELYKMAGLSNVDVLRSATGNAAKAFDLPIGQLQVGSEATMLLLNGNPIEDFEHLREVEYVWKNGRTE